MTEPRIRLPEVYQCLGNDEGEYHSSWVEPPFEPIVNGYFLTVEQAEKIIEALESCSLDDLEYQTHDDALIKQAIAILKGEK